VAAGTAYELLCLLYRQVQATQGYPPLPPALARLAPPKRLWPDTEWFFSGDIALGMNVISLARQRGWASAEDLADGLARLDTYDLIQAMLRPPEGTRQQLRQRTRDVTAVLRHRAGGAKLLASLQREGFHPAAVAALLGKPEEAARAFTHLMAEHTTFVRQRRALLEAPLNHAARAAQTILARHSLPEALQQLCPGWKLQDPLAFASITLIPSPALAPFLSARLTWRHEALIIYPVRGGQQPGPEELAGALQALADSQRLEILRLCMAGPVTGHALAQTLGLTGATIHHHTSRLRAAGLLASTRAANRVYHTSRPQLLEHLFQATILALSPLAQHTNSQHTDMP
jgi:DNA-binding transcriptional ArsR family regulator